MKQEVKAERRAEVCGDLFRSPTFLPLRATLRVLSNPRGDVSDTKLTFNILILSITNISVCAGTTHTLTVGVLTADISVNMFVGNHQLICNHGDCPTFVHVLHI